MSIRVRYEFEIPETKQNHGIITYNGSDLFNFWTQLKGFPNEGRIILNRADFTLDSFEEIFGEQTPDFDNINDASLWTEQKLENWETQKSKNLADGSN